LAAKTKKARRSIQDSSEEEQRQWGAKKPIRKSPDTEVDEEVLDFIAAIDAYKKEKNRPFPNWSEVLLVLKELGYKKS
jgi:hypothetical protein